MSKLLDAVLGATLPLGLKHCVDPLSDAVWSVEVA